MRLSAGDTARGERLAGRISLDIEGEVTAFEIDVPAGPVAPDDLMPIFQGLADVAVASATRTAERAGKTISCRAGCGACCRQLVPVAESEARVLGALVSAMPEARRAQIRARFHSVLASLVAGGLLERLERATADGGEDVVALGMDYFRRGLACPFLEGESCSIHADRPLSCREFLVTSPARNCAAPSAETVDVVDVKRVSLGLAEARRAATHEGWTPLVMALKFAAASPAPARDRAAPEIIRAVIDGAR